MAKAKGNELGMVERKHAAVQEDMVNLMGELLLSCFFV
jgi:hypothetical protein